MITRHVIMAGQAANSLPFDKIQIPDGCAQLIFRSIQDTPIRLNWGVLDGPEPDGPPISLKLFGTKQQLLHFIIIICRLTLK